MISGQIKSFQYTFAGDEREFIAFDSTISRDGHSGETFDFCISNPPFGTPWKEDLKKRGLKETEKAKFTDSRFSIAVGSGDNQEKICFLPDISDCQMLFLANNVSRMVDDTVLGTRIVEVHNGSSLFTGDAGSGASNLRKYIIENDLLEAIIAMPEKDFYNTGIGTYIWVVTNRKAEHRKGFVQLIDATKQCTPLRKNLGEKNCETSEVDRKVILRLLTDFKETEQSKIFPNQEFGYYKVTVERPLRLTYEKLERACTYIRNGAVFLATHLDINCPTKDGFIPDCGAMCAAISLSTGKEPKYVGKPFKETVDMVLEMTGAKREAMSFVGDRIYTDVKTGVVNGAHGILVLTGETKLEDVPKADVVPDAIFTGLKEMGEYSRL